MKNLRQMRPIRFCRPMYFQLSETLRWAGNRVRGRGAERWSHSEHRREASQNHGSKRGRRGCGGPPRPIQRRLRPHGGRSPTNEKNTTLAYFFHFILHGFFPIQHIVFNSEKANNK